MVVWGEGRVRLEPTTALRLAGFMGALLGLSCAGHFNALHLASSHGQDGAATVLLDNGADINAKSEARGSADAGLVSCSSQTLQPADRSVHRFIHCLLRR